MNKNQKRTLICLIHDDCPHGCQLLTDEECDKFSLCNARCRRYMIEKYFPEVFDKEE